MVNRGEQPAPAEAVTGDRGPPASGLPAGALTGLDDYMRATARLRGLTVEPEWWPGIRAHLAQILELGTDVERHDPVRGQDPARNAGAAPSGGR